MPGNKLYSQKEIKELLQKATELQRKSAPTSEEGLTLEELEQIASDSGIDPLYIREAVSAQNSSPTSTSRSQFLGIPLSLEIGREVPFNLSLDDWELVVQEARSTFNKSGVTVQKLGKSLEWMSPDSKFIHASLTATPLETKTRFFVSSRFGKVAFFTFYLTFVLLIILMSIILGNVGFPPLINILFGAISGATLFSGARFLFGKWVNSQKNKLENMISRFEKLISFDDETSVSSSVKNEPRIVIPEDENTEREDSISTQHNTRS